MQLGTHQILASTGVSRWWPWQVLRTSSVFSWEPVSCYLYHLPIEFALVNGVASIPQQILIWLFFCFLTAAALICIVPHRMEAS